MRTVYGESLSNPEVLNLRGQAYRVYDGAGVQTAVAYDFKGGPLAAERQLAVEYTQTPDWVDLAELEDVSDLEVAAASMLEAEVFRTESSFDALGRPVTQTTPDGSVVRLAYEAALLEGVSANVRGAASPTDFVSNIDYDAKGRRALIAYGNGTQTSYSYDDVTQRLPRPPGCVETAVRKCDNDDASGRLLRVRCRRKRAARKVAAFGATDRRRSRSCRRHDQSSFRARLAFGGRLDQWASPTSHSWLFHAFAHLETSFDADSWPLAARLCIGFVCREPRAISAYEGVVRPRLRPRVTCRLQARRRKLRGDGVWSPCRLREGAVGLRRRMHVRAELDRRMTRLRGRSADDSRTEPQRTRGCQCRHIGARACRRPTVYRIRCFPNATALTHRQRDRLPTAPRSRTQPPALASACERRPPR